MKSRKPAYDSETPELGPLTASTRGPLRPLDLEPERRTLEDSRMQMQMQDNNDKFVEQRIEQSDLQAVALMYDDLLKLVPNRSQQETNTMVKAFDSHLQMVMGTLEQRSTDIQSPYVRSMEVIQAKQGILDVVVQEVLNYVEQTSPNPNVVTLLRGLFAIHEDLIASGEPTVQACVDHYERQMHAQRRQMQSSAASQPKQQQRTQSAPAPPLASAQQSQKPKPKPKPKDSPASPRYAPDKTWSDLVKSTRVTETIRRSDATDPSVVEKEGFRTLFNTESPPPKMRYKASPAKEKKQNVPQPGRNLSQRTVVELIDDIYASKIKYDEQCKTNGLPLETMGQHVFTFLSQRYGLGRLVNDWIEALQIGTRKYSSESVDVLVFAHIINNDIDEDFRFVHSQVKSTSGDLLKVFLRGKYPTKSEKDLADMITSRITSKVLEDEWTYIIRNLYNEEDSAVLSEQIYAKIDAEIQNNNTKMQSMNKKEMYAIMFKDLMELVLMFQLNGHIRFLSKFRHLFRLFDADEDGVLSHDQTVDLLLAVNPELTPNEVLEIVNASDPAGANQFTFSQCVGIVSSKLVKHVSTRQNVEEDEEEATSY